MDSNSIKAELIQKREHRRTVLDEYNRDIAETESKIEDAKVHVHTMKTKLDSSEAELKHLHESKRQCDEEIEKAKDSLSRSESAMVHQRESLLGHVSALADIYKDSLVKPLNHIIATYKDVAKTATGPIIVNNVKDLQSIIDSCTDSLVVVDGMDGSTLTIRAQQTTDSQKSTPIQETDCSCTQSDLFETTFKLQKQTLLDSGKIQYHLILKMQSKYIDFVSDENPLKNNSMSTMRSVAPILRWNTTGSISSKHKLNDTRQPCKITDVETGPASVELNSKSYELDVKFDGNKLSGPIKFTKQNQRTNEWNMTRGN